MRTINAMTGTMIQQSIKSRAAELGYRMDAKSGIGIVGMTIKGLKAVEDKGNRDIVGVATNDFTDSSDEVVLPEGADLSYITQTRTLYSDHYYGISNAIGKIRQLSQYNENGVKGWKFRAYIYPGMKSGIGDDCLTIIREGGDLGVSIGFEATDWGSPTAEEFKRYPSARAIIRKWRWIELSLTAMPCNMTCAAMLVPAEMEKARTAFLSDMVSKGRIKRESAIALGMEHETVVQSVCGPKRFTIQSRGNVLKL